MVVAMIAPEAVILWAMRQWISAYKLGKKYRSYGWTQSHGYYAIMGGFMIFEGDKGHTVMPDELGELLKNGNIRITKEEIRDKGRGDALSKGLILVQTTWFILQCIARRVEGLPITELELVTLAFAALNFVTYAVWWNKPLNVECAMRVYGKEEAEDKADTGGTGKIEGDQGEGGVRSMIVEDINAAISRAKVTIEDTPSAIRQAFQDCVSNYRYKWWHTLAALLSPVLVPLLVLMYVITISSRLGGGNTTWFGDDDDDDDDVIKEAQQVPAFHAGELTVNEVYLAVTAAFVIAMIFGGIHCVAWSFEFPSYTEQLLWRIASISITSGPVLAFLLAPVGYWDYQSVIRIPTWLNTIFGIITITGSTAYVTGRIVLLVLPFMSLRSLPAEAYQTVQWTTFIPHV
jgi:hypothetical protein